MNTPRIYAKVTHSFGTSSTIVILADSNPHRRLASISPEAVGLLHRLISADGRGIETDALSPNETRALNHDIEGTLRIRLRRTRKAGHIILAGNVAIVDQRTLNAEAA